MLLLFTCIIALYPALRISDMLSAEGLSNISGIVFDEKRVESLEVRLWEEDLFIEKTLERPLLGWAGSEDGWPKTADGNKTVHVNVTTTNSPVPSVTMGTTDVQVTGVTMDTTVAIATPMSTMPPTTTVFMTTVEPTTFTIWPLTSIQ